MSVRWVFLGILFSCLVSGSAFAGGKSCTWVLDPQATRLEWTSYKFSERTPVMGTFNEISYDYKASEDLVATLRTLKVAINTLSVETQDKGRNANIAEGFFKMTAAPHLIQASLKEMPASPQGEAQVHFSFNATERTLPMTYTIGEGGEVTFTGGSDMEAFGLTAAFENLKKLCKALHIGKDGKSVSWPDFQLKFVPKFEKKCS